MTASPTVAICERIMRTGHVVRFNHVWSGRTWPFCVYPAGLLMRKAPLHCVETVERLEAIATRLEADAPDD